MELNPRHGITPLLDHSSRTVLAPRSKGAIGLVAKGWDGPGGRSTAVWVEQGIDIL